MDSLGKGPSTILDPTYGSLLVGVIIAAMFQGMLMVQAYNYYENFPSDRMKNKVVVFLVLIWTFSRRNVWITLGLLILALAPVILEIHITTLIVKDTSVAEYERNKTETMALFIATAIADISIAGVMCYYLQREESAFEVTRSVVSKALHIVVGSGLATSLIAIGSLILYISVKNTFYFISLHFQLGRTYTNALLLTLNARHQMRQMLGETYRSNRSNQLELGVVSNGRGTVKDVENIVCLVQKTTVTDQLPDSKSDPRVSNVGSRGHGYHGFMSDKGRNQISFVDVN
ncbi:hypothetical protein CVT24_004480 [Panaeolus cyanescens]|uniref:DUF6534 domain-containing protein n=1 Tax=Panaeolus cyanescens TaxID=181874 RepID=A0A409YBM3_9AGAR|nr:hypothetical protein CVT24_004480 [Panaeolus cyanescens]